jgi:hypothetical protein
VPGDPPPPVPAPFGVSGRFGVGVEAAGADGPEGAPPVAGPVGVTGAGGGAGGAGGGAGGGGAGSETGL